jgi:tRNA-guanine family transglycosylase
MLWLGQSARTTVVTREYPELANGRWMASLGDAIHRPRMLDTVFGPSLRERLSIAGPLMLDSGGFTNMTRGGSLTLDQVARAFKTVGADIVVSLDLPPLAHDSVDLRLAKYMRTTENYASLHGDVLGAILAPVLHGVTPDELFLNCRAIAGIEPNPQWVCVGGQVPLLRQAGSTHRAGLEARRSLQESIGLVRAQFPRSSLHVLGVGSPRNVQMALAAGADSVDSIGWRRAAGFGTIFLPGGTERFVSPRDRKRANSRKYLSEDDYEALRICGCPVCRRGDRLQAKIDALGASYLARAAHNAWTLIEETAASDCMHKGFDTENAD